MDQDLVAANVDLSAIEKNVQNLNRMTPRSASFMAVVKANGYGHGAVAVARKALESGADWLGVARFEEALELRNAGIASPILVFGRVHPSRITRVLDLDLVLTVYDPDMAAEMSSAAQKAGGRARVHFKVDTGMGRVGMIIGPSSDTAARKKTLLQISGMASLPGIDPEGLYTHFAAADHRDAAYTLAQIERFNGLVSDLEQQQISFPIVHAANSAGIIRFPQAHYDMVRAGISLYGCYPSEDVDPSLVSLFPAMTLTAKITSVKAVPRGFKVSYGMTYETRTPTTLASVPIGYADGFSRHFSNNGCMLVNGERAPIAGRVCMDQTMIDVGHIPGVAPGDEVVVFGAQNNARLSVDELARNSGTINYEILSALTARVPRRYSGTGSG